MDCLAALGIVLPITLIIQAFANLVGLGGSPKASIKLGQKDLNEANQVFNASALLLLFFGLVISIFTFIFSKNIIIAFGCPSSAIQFATSNLRIYSLGSIFVLLAQGLNPFIITCLGHSLLAMMSALIWAIINIGLDPLFIFVF